MLIKSSAIRQLLYWLFNIISPSINAQTIITYILAHKSAFCKFLVGPSTSDDSGFSFFKSIGDDTIGLNWVILVLHVVVFLALLILIDTGLLKSMFSSIFSCWSKSPDIDENRLDSDVLAERHRILKANDRLYNQNTANVYTNQDGPETDHLTVHDLVKRFPGRPTAAVNHLTFGAKRGEAFGLLGYNVSPPSPSRHSPHSTAHRERAKQLHSRFSSATRHPPRAPPSSTDKTSTIASDPFVVLATVHSKIAAWNS